ncbi:MAG: hypothetical protein JW967_04500 [Dehalococcoidales bacterium]|nr:hypothetical protein [Dehalococcoidales bacterium]
MLEKRQRQGINDSTLPPSGFFAIFEYKGYSNTSRMTIAWFVMLERSEASQGGV